MNVVHRDHDEDAFRSTRLLFGVASALVIAAGISLFIFSEQTYRFFA